jgi:hypothetical protein
MNDDTKSGLTKGGLTRSRLSEMDEQIAEIMIERGIEFDDLIEAMIDYNGGATSASASASANANAGSTADDDERINMFLNDLYKRCEYEGELAADMITICGTLLLEGYFDDTDLEDEIIGYEINNGKLWIYVCRGDGSGVVTLLRRIEQILEQYRIGELNIVECEERMMGCSEHPTLLDTI